jgi:hypothetical protein
MDCKTLHFESDKFSKLVIRWAKVFANHRDLAARSKNSVRYPIEDIEKFTEPCRIGGWRDVGVLEVGGAVMKFKNGGNFAYFSRERRSKGGQMNLYNKKVRRQTIGG